MQKGEPYRRKFTEHKTNNHQFGIKGVEYTNEGWRYPSTVLDFPQKWRRQDQIHPTQKPVELMEFLVMSYCPADGVVLDNCMGSGSTGVACVNTGRRFIGMELEERYFGIAEKRISDACNRLF
jgi:site-specific DNA-methyltransferase (adenine-specific)